MSTAFPRSEYDRRLGRLRGLMRDANEPTELTRTPRDLVPRA